MKKLLLTFLLGIMLVFSLTFTSYPEENFTSKSSLFSIGTGARPLGLRGAFVGLSNDENALLYNPAGLAFLNDSGITSFYSNQYNAGHFSSLVFAKQYLGLGHIQLGSGSIKERDLLGNPIGEFSYHTMGIVGAYAYAFQNISLGLQGKMYKVSSPESARGFSLTPCLLIKQGAFQIGAVFENPLATGINYQDGHKEPWQKRLKVGGAFVSKDMSIDIDFIRTMNSSSRHPNIVCAGFESWRFSPVGLRFGIDTKMRMSGGLSVKLKNFQLDYALESHSSLPLSHRISFTTRFSGFSLSDLEDSLAALWS